MTGTLPMRWQQEGARRSSDSPLHPQSPDIASSSALRVLCRAESIDKLRNDIRDGRADPQLLKAQLLSDAALTELAKKPREVLRFAKIRERELNKLEEEKFLAIRKHLFPGSP
ncbi:MAG: hypothetical protein IT372_16750 [Polyangiaceae bacterium]|nr:hypothetical protein [Polyangiaceae bacterium]